MALTGPCNNFLIIFFGRKKIYFFSPDRDFNKKIHIFCARPGFLQTKVVKKSTFCEKSPKSPQKNLVLSLETRVRVNRVALGGIDNGWPCRLQFKGVEWGVVGPFHSPGEWVGVVGEWMPLSDFFGRFRSRNGSR